MRQRENGTPDGHRQLTVWGTVDEIRAVVDRYADAGELLAMTTPRPADGGPMRITIKLARAPGRGPVDRPGARAVIVPRQRGALPARVKTPRRWPLWLRELSYRIRISPAGIVGLIAAGVVAGVVWLIWRAISAAADWLTADPLRSTLALIIVLAVSGVVVPLGIVAGVKRVGRAVLRAVGRGGGAHHCPGCRDGHR